MSDVTFEAILTTVDGKPYTCGPVSIGVIAGDDDARPGEGVVTHKHAGLWRYYPAGHEVGPFRTVVAFSATGAITGFDRRQGPILPPVPPASLDGVTAVTRTQFGRQGTCPARITNSGLRNCCKTTRSL
jgi:hypothetical protein